MRKFLVNILSVFLILSTLSSSVYAAHGERDVKLPDEELSSSVLPIVQSYETDSKSGKWAMKKSTRFVIPATEEYLNNSRLKEVVELISAEFLEKEIPAKKEIKKVYAEESKISPKDIVVTLAKNNKITKKSNSKEAYKITIGSDGVKIVAASENAALYALRTIQHLMITNNNNLVYGTIIDYPDLAERRVHVDMARKYITKDWIIQHIRELSYFKMNTIQLHFSENLGFRIESDFDPKIVSQDGYLKKSEVKEILAEAKKYGVNVIPSLDTPGHVEHILKVHPEYGQIDINGEKSKVALDVTNPEAVNYIKGLYSEYLELFKGSADFHIGADEYMEFDRPPFTTKYKKVLNDYAVKTLGEGYTWKDTMANYINEIAAHVYQAGFKPRIWNDGIYYGETNKNSWEPEEPKQKIKMHEYIGIDFWSQMSWNRSIARLDTFVEKGHKDIYNINASFFYYVLRPSMPDDGRKQHSFDYLNQDVRIYNEWTPGKFQENTVPDDSDFIKGASLAIWNDKPDLVGEDIITADIAKELRSLASKSWNTRSNEIADIDKFKENYQKLGNVAGFAKGSELPKVKPFLPVGKEEPFDKSALKQLISDAKKRDKNDYTSDSWTVFKKALKEAKAVLRNKSATKEEVDQAIANLEKAINSVNDDKSYQIYPIPQSIVYSGGSLKIGSNINVVFESGLDDATKNRLIEVLAIKNIKHTVGSNIQEGKTNVIVGINNSGEIADKYFNAKGLDDEGHFTKNDSHIISVKDNVIAVLGKDTDSAFYGITSLKFIFKQLEGSEIRNLLIKDYSDGHWRGFIEGYYGIPWTNENRMSLMEFGGDFKMNTYIFAPKDDEYHSLKWREPYPAEKLTEIKEMVEVGAASKNKFIWTIHPFLHNAIQFDDEAKYQEDLATIITKFEQLYDVGVRQFGVLGDDAAEGEAADQVRLMNDLEEWRVSKGDVYSFIFVPKVYTKESAGGDVNNEYLNTIGQMPESTEIMWTGDVVLGDVNNETFEFFKEAVGREAFMWLNWPVNDINNKRLLMGKGEMLDPSVTNFRGIVTNPMQEAQASKVALFAIADYSWNREGFNMDKSWSDSFHFIEPDAAEEMHTFAKHMSDPTPNWHGLALEESEELAPYIEDFTNKLFAGKTIEKDSKFLLKEYKKIIDATNSFANKSKNELLKAEIKGWVDSLRDEAESTIAYINAAVAFEQGNYDEAMKFYVQGGDEYTASRSHRVPAINGQTRPEPGTKYLVPFINDLSRLISEKFTQKINPDTNRLVLFPYTNMGPNLYWGHIQNIVDGGTDRLSTMWVRRGAKADDYVAVELSEVTDVTSIIFEHGEPGAGDSFNFVKFQYSMDGKKWKDIDGKEYGPHTQKIVIEDLNVKAKHIRVIPTGELKSNWISVRELSINKDDAGHIKRDIYTNVDALAANKVDIFPTNATLADVKGITLAKGQYVGIKLNKIRELTTIIADVTNNDKLTLEASINGVEWSEVTDLAKITNARYVRVINNTKDAVTFDITNLEVEYSNKDVTFEVRPAAEARFEAANLIDGKLNTAFKPGVNAPKSGSLVYKISDRTDITRFTVIQSPSTISDAVVSVRTDNGWFQVGTLAESENVFSTAKSKNVFEIKIEWDEVAPTLHEIGISSVKKKDK